MKRNSTNGLLTLNFGWMCVAHFLLFASVYLLFPLLPFLMDKYAGGRSHESAALCLSFLAGLFLVGPFHAYLGDAYKRKGVLMLSTLGLSVVTLGYLWIESSSCMLLLSVAQGACFGLATTAGLTVTIDITASASRSSGNRAYAWAARSGMFLATVAGLCLFHLCDFRVLVYASSACALLSLVTTSWVYVAFRAPMGVGLFNLDRFLLPRAWLPALNMLLIAFVPGLLLPLLYVGDYWVLFPLFLLLCFTGYFIRMFIRLSHHCQRGTANTTCHLSVEAGLMLGVSLSFYIQTMLPLVSSEAILYPIAGMAAVISLIFFVAVTLPYYERKRVR